MLKLCLLVRPRVGLLQAPYLEDGEYDRSLLLQQEGPGEVGERLLRLVNPLERWLVMVAAREPEEGLGQSAAATETDKEHLEEKKRRFNSCLR